jgi:hypothetical protein
MIAWENANAATMTLDRLSHQQIRRNKNRAASTLAFTLRS